MTSTAVIQAKQGIGDVMWHLPFIRAIAGTTPEGKVTFLAPPTTHAVETLQAEPCVAQVLYFQHGGSELQRGRNLYRLARLLRARRFRSVWIIDKTLRPAIAARLARIPERIGLGLGAQRLFITNPGIDQKHFHDMPIDWLKALMAAKNIQLTSTEPSLTLPAPLQANIARCFAGEARPWIVVGVGASHPDKDWTDERWLEFVRMLRQTATGTIFLIGGKPHAARAARLVTGTAGAAIIDACGLSVVEAAALLKHADLFVGTDSGPMNLAAAVGTDAYGMFGSTPVLDYSRHIHAIGRDDGQPSSRDGMQQISPARVMARIAPALAAAAAASGRPRSSP